MTSDTQAIETDNTRRFQTAQGFSLMQNNIENVLTKRNIMKQLISIIMSCYLAYCKMFCLQ